MIDMNQLKASLASRSSKTFTSAEEAKKQIGSLFATNWESQIYRVPLVVELNDVPYEQQKHWLAVTLIGMGRSQKMDLAYPLIPITKEEADALVDQIRNQSHSTERLQSKIKPQRGSSPNRFNAVNTQQPIKESYKMTTEANAAKETVAKVPTAYSIISAACKAGKSKDEAVNEVVKVLVEKDNPEDRKKLKVISHSVYAQAKKKA